MQLRRTLMTAAALGLVAVTLTGCVTSQASIYEAHLTSRIKSDRHPFPAVALAFGLEGSDGTVAVAAVRDK